MMFAKRKEAMASSTVIKLIIMLVLVVAVIAVFFPMVLQGANSLKDFLGIGEESQKIKQTVLVLDYVRDALDICNNDPEYNCFCKIGISEFIKQLPANEAISFSQDGNKIRLRYKTEVRFVENAKLCWVPDLLDFSVSKFNKGESGYLSRFAPQTLELSIDDKGIVRYGGNPGSGFSFRGLGYFSSAFPVLKTHGELCISPLLYQKYPHTFPILEGDIQICSLYPENTLCEERGNKCVASSEACQGKVVKAVCSDLQKPVCCWEL
jgi:hypothetical protein